MYFNAKDEMVTIVPNFSLPTENCTTFCIGVRAAAAAQARRSLLLRCALAPLLWLWLQLGPPLLLPCSPPAASPLCNPPPPLPT